MNKTIIVLTDKELEYVVASLQQVYEKAMIVPEDKREERYLNSYYPAPLNFEKEINGTVYHVNTIFDKSSEQSVEEQIKRFLKVK